MPRPSLLQAIFRQPSQSYVAGDTAYAESAPPRRGWRPSASLKRSVGAHYGDDPHPITLAKTCAGGLSNSGPSKARGRVTTRPSTLDMHKADIVAAVPTLTFLASPSASPLSSVTASPSPTPPLVSPASTPKSSTPSFTDETSDSSADPEFFTPPDSPKPPAHSTAVIDVAVVSLRQLGLF
ncbi:hypothetical protein FRC08_002510 [Ceratobasidium sp. 394]|nr:hypothetical protein FRC08_002510 [Ceratobasidium sp. 394]